MERKYFMLYSFAAIAFSNFHIHFMLVDAWKQRNKNMLSDMTKEKPDCYWMKTIERIAP